MPPGGQFIMNIVQGISQHWEGIKTAATQTVNYFGEQIKTAISQATTWGADLIQNLINGIKQKWEALKTTVGQTAGQIKKYLGFSEPEEGPLADFHTYAPDMVDLFIKGIKDNQRKLQNSVAEAFDFGETIIDQGVIGRSVSTTASGLPEKNVTVILQLDKTQLGKAVFQLNKEESRRIGVEMTYA
jgi:phage-related protein